MGGACGALLRYYWGILFSPAYHSFPWAVFTENITGAFVLGWLLTIFVRQRGRHRYLRAFFGTGLIGSFTTFSGITADLALFSGIATDPVTSSGAFNPVLLVLYPVVSILAGLGAAWAGWSAGRYTRYLCMPSPGSGRNGETPAESGRTGEPREPGNPGSKHE